MRKKSEEISKTKINEGRLTISVQCYSISKKRKD
jgi:hypothetical protein